jgi:hypothetical protein
MAGNDTTRSVAAAPFVGLPCQRSLVRRTPRGAAFASVTIAARPVSRSLNAMPTDAINAAV